MSSPHYNDARVALYLAIRAAGVPDQFAGPIADEALAFAARAAADYLTTAPVADRVIVRDHRGTRLAAEAPDPGARDEAQLRALATPR